MDQSINTVSLPAELAALSTSFSSQQVLSNANRHCGSSELIRQPQQFLHTSARPAQGDLNQQYQQYWAFQCLGASSSSFCISLTMLCACTDPQSAEKAASQADGSTIQDSASITEGPMRAYLDGRNSGLFKPDPRQENTIKLLQALYDQLKQVHLEHKRPSGLTTTDHIGLDKPRHSWYACMLTAFHTACLLLHICMANSADTL